MSSRNFKSRDARASSIHGFSLIELLIALAIIGILSAIAYPQYGKYVEKTRRTDGRMALLKEVQSLERCKATSYSYTGCTLSSSVSEEKNYAITLASTASTYTITATAQNKQVSDTECKVMTINHLGTMTPDPDTTSCWPQ